MGLFRSAKFPRKTLQANVGRQGFFLRDRQDLLSLPFTMDQA